MSQSQHNNLYGISFMLLNALSIAVLYATMKFLTKSLSSSQVVFFYKFAILILILPWVFKNGLSAIKTERFYLHLTRGFLSIGGSLSFMYALQHVEMVDATALGYLEQVLLVIIGMIYFKEQVTKSKIFAIVASFIGAIVIVYPEITKFESGSFVPVLFKKKDFSNYNHYYLFVLLSILFWASNCVVVKKLSKTEKTKTQMFYVMLFSSIFAYPIAFIKWSFPEVGFIKLPVPTEHIDFSTIGLQLEHIPFIATLAACYFIHGIAIFQAYKHSEMSLVVPFDYSRLVFTGLFGYYLFNEIPLHYAYIGYFLIVGSGILLIKSEAVRKRKAFTKQKLEALEEELGHV